MKQKDIALIILIAGIAGVISFFVSRALFSNTTQRSQQTAVVDPITTDFTNPSSKYFNSSSIDPTQLIQIGNNNNSNPFNGATTQ